MRFQIDQRFPAPPEVVLAAYTDPALYEHMQSTTHVDRPRLLDITRESDAVVVRVHYRLVADVPAAVLAVVDRSKLTWVDETRYDLAARTSSSRLLPVHYADRISGWADSTFTPDPADATVTHRHITGEVAVRAPLVAGRVERAIVEGVEEHLTGEAAAVAAHLDAAT